LSGLFHNETINQGGNAEIQTFVPYTGRRFFVVSSSLRKKMTGIVKNKGGEGMLDIKRIRTELDVIKAAMARRGEMEVDLDAVVALDEKRRMLLQEVEQMKSEQNAVSKEIPMLKKAGKTRLE
jgi:hypothetical protein